MSYLVRCALPAGHSIVLTNAAGTATTYPGQLGVAPEWENGACLQGCQESVSACLLAHVNTTGRHIGLWLDSDIPSLGWGRSTDYPYQEGSFFGNIFTSPPKAYFCNGKDFDLGAVPGRLGVGQANAPYTNPFAGTGFCQDSCTEADAPSTGDGYKACNGFSHVVTVWRNFDASTAYKVCNRSTGQCMDTASSFFGPTKFNWTNYSGSASQKWNIVQVKPGSYKFINGKSANVLDFSGTFLLTQNIVLLPYAGTSSQMWNFLSTKDGYYKFVPTSNPNIVLSITGWLLGTNADHSQQWTVVPAQ